jgi:TonB-dependent SusC/RagA subfamily outer membrane receptor
MTTPAPRALPPAALLLGLLAACAHSSQRTNPEAPPAAPAEGPVVTAEDLQRNRGQPIEQALMARFPGVMVSRTPDGGVSVRIRGGSSIYGSNEPLYVLDGIPIQPGPNGSLSGISPEDIESIKVLKDPAETAMYGVRGANGVIVIKSKRPR